MRRLADLVVRLFLVGMLAGCFLTSAPPWEVERDPMDETKIEWLSSENVKGNDQDGEITLSHASIHIKCNGAMVIFTDAVVKVKEGELLWLRVRFDSALDSVYT